MQTYDAKVRAWWLIVFCFLSIRLFADEKTGKVCVQSISIGDSWKANDTGAKESSTFKVQIDKLAPILISTNSSGVFTNLSLGGKHLVKIQLDEKPLTSFRFSFQEEQSEHLRLWYSPFYGTWSLWRVGSHEKCACPTKSN
jgi:hypothetical protein